MRGWIVMFAALTLCAFAGAASAQSALSCSAVPQSVCDNADLLGLESERAALVAQLTAADPQHAAIASEQTWTDGLSACGEDIECYRTAYLNHNQTLRQSTSALPGAAATDPTLEAPADAPSVEEQTQALDEAQADRLRAPPEPRETGDLYVSSGFPGWGFFTAIGVTLLLGWMLLRARARHRGE